MCGQIKLNFDEQGLNRIETTDDGLCDDDDGGLNGQLLTTRGLWHRREIYVVEANRDCAVLYAWPVAGCVDSHVAPAQGQLLQEPGAVRLVLDQGERAWVAVARKDSVSYDARLTFVRRRLA